MPEPHDASDKASQDLGRRLDTLEAERAKKATVVGGMNVGDAYRLVASFIGGVLGGLGLGWLFDHFAGTSPIGIAAGLLIGSGISLYSIITTSVRMTKKALEEHPPEAVPFDDDDDD